MPTLLRRIYDWMKPPIDFDDWKTREQTRRRTDAENATLLEYAKIEKELEKAERTFAKARATYEAKRANARTAKNRRLELAAEYGVFQGDDQNPIDWHKKRTPSPEEEGYEKIARIGGRFKTRKRHIRKYKY